MMLFQKVLEYNDYRNFLNVIEKAKEACKNSGHDIVDHFVDATDMIDIDKGEQRQAADVRLSRYACYLVVQNGDPAKPVIAKGQKRVA
jgi:DNA-damage-inducible protein D